MTSHYYVVYYYRAKSGERNALFASFSVFVECARFRGKIKNLFFLLTERVGVFFVEEAVSQSVAKS
jgi:hypothetical protein